MTWELSPGTCIRVFVTWVRSPGMYILCIRDLPTGWGVEGFDGVFGVCWVWGVVGWGWVGCGGDLRGDVG